jgi:hypothetical protein
LEALGSEAFVQDTEARRIECFVLAGRHQEALELLPSELEEVEDRPLVGAFLERLHGYALFRPVARARRACGSSGASSSRPDKAPTTRWR